MTALNELNRDSDWSDIDVTVVGAGIAGVGAAGVLARMGAKVELTDQGDIAALSGDRRVLIDQLVASQAVSVKDKIDGWTGNTPHLLVVSPGVKPFAEVVLRAKSQGVPIWGELELAWRLRPISNPAHWLLVSGTNGKTTTTLMAAAMANFGPTTAQAIGNIGVSAVQAVTQVSQPSYFVVETSAAQMVFTDSLRPEASVVLNLAPDHLDYFGSMSQYQAAKAKVYSGVTRAAIFNIADPTTHRMIDQIGIPPGVKTVGFSLGKPELGQVGVADDFLIDNAFGVGEIALAPLSDVKPAADHNIANALAAASLVRAVGIEPQGVSHGLATYQPAPHRIADVGVVEDIRFIDDSKATNAHAAATSIRSYRSVVWVAGGLGKGQDFTGLVQDVRAHLRGVVLIGKDRHEIAAALKRHSPSTPVVEVIGSDAACMPEVVGAAKALAQSGDVVLLAPACASWDMFTNYQQRGQAFADAVSELANVVSAK